jgi:hypothetical protein
MPFSAPKGARRMALVRPPHCTHVPRSFRPFASVLVATLAAAPTLVACSGADEATTDIDVATDDAVSPLSAADLAKLRDAVRRDPLTPELSAACPWWRRDALCGALRDAESRPSTETLARARTAVRDRVSKGPLGAAMSDAAVKYWIRERVHALSALHDAAGLTPPDTEPAFFGASVERHFRTFYPLFDASSFKLAKAYLPPAVSGACAKPRETLLVFPGVIRLPTKTELDVHLRALRIALPCLHIVRVDTGTFVDVEVNAQKGLEAIRAADADVGPLPLHFLGYSQGVTNALRTITADPAVAPRTRSVVSLNSAAHGSEAADTLLRTLRLYEARPTAGCEEMWPGVRDLCFAVAKRDLTPTAAFLQSMLERMGASFDDIEGRDVGQWLRIRTDGLRSLTTGGTDQFWATHGAKLPRDAAYLTFRSVISDEKATLPQSNWLSYQVLFRASSRSPWNDMQVRLENQPLGRNVASSEVVLRVADGNHWQWALTAEDVPERLMPARMFEGIPREAMVVAQYETLAEIGVVTTGDSK